MNAIATLNSTFTVADTTINMVDGLYSLNDLHRASGGETKHRPTFFMRNDETKALIAEIEKSDVQICTSTENKAFRVVKGNFGKVKQGTYVCKELVYRYAMWISAKFSLMVIRAFDELVNRTDSKQREALITACDKLAVGNALRSDIYSSVANHFGYDKISQLPTPLLPEAVAYVYEELLARQKFTAQSQDAEYNALWKTIGLLEYERISNERRKLQRLLNDALQQFQLIHKTEGLLYDALVEQRINATTSSQERLAKAQAFIERQLAMKG